MEECLISHIFKKEIHDFIGQTLYEIEQRKKGIVTDMMKQEEAIKNIPLVHIPAFSEDECVQIWKIHKLVLGRSFFENNGNEVAVVCDLDSYIYKDGFTKQKLVVGTLNEVKILADKDARNIIDTAKNISIFITHNHPNNTSFSFDDLLMFTYLPNVRLLSVIGNDGHIEYIYRDKNNYSNDIKGVLTNIISGKEEYMIEFANKYNDKPENSLVANSIVNEIIYNIGKLEDYLYKNCDPKLKEDLLKNQDFINAYKHTEFANFSSSEEKGITFMKEVVKIHGADLKAIREAADAVTSIEHETTEFSVRLFEDAQKIEEYRKAKESAQVETVENTKQDIQ